MPNIKIRISGGVETAGDGVEQQESSAKKQQAEKLAVASIFAHQAINTTKQIINYSVSNIGNLTGDYVKQSQVQEKLSIVGDLVTIGTAFAAGPVAGAIATIGITTKQIMGAISENITDRKRERENAFLRIRNGNSTKSGSRETEN